MTDVRSTVLRTGSADQVEDDGVDDHHIAHAFTSNCLPMASGCYLIIANSILLDEEFP